MGNQIFWLGSKNCVDIFYLQILWIKKNDKNKIKKILMNVYDDNKENTKIFFDHPISKKLELDEKIIQNSSNINDIDIDEFDLMICIIKLIIFPEYITIYDTHIIHLFWYRGNEFSKIKTGFSGTINKLGQEN